MEVKTVMNSLLEHNKNRAFISITSLRAWLGVGRNNAVDLVDGLETLGGKYFVPEVAKRIVERSIHNG